MGKGKGKKKVSFLLVVILHQGILYIDYQFSLAGW